MKKLITLLEILSLNSVEKEMSEALDVYDNVNFKDNVVGNSAPSRDNINTALLQDVQTAAKVAGVKVDITTAVSGHKPGSRHESGNAVDIAIINDKAVSLANRIDADKLVDALVKMGYQKNVEVGYSKAVLTFGFKGHDNHVHVSNKDGQPSKYNNDGVSSPESVSTSGDTTTSGDQSSSTTTNSSSGEFDTIAQNIQNGILGSLTSAAVMKESVSLKEQRLINNIKKIKKLL
jgi:hypothetical protein